MQTTEGPTELFGAVLNRRGDFRKVGPGHYRQTEKPVAEARLKRLTSLIDIEQQQQTLSAIFLVENMSSFKSFSGRITRKIPPAMYSQEAAEAVWKDIVESEQLSEGLRVTLSQIDPDWNPMEPDILETA